MRISLFSMAGPQIHSTYFSLPQIPAHEKDDRTFRLFKPTGYTSVIESIHDINPKLFSMLEKIPLNTEMTKFFKNTPVLFPDYHFW
jgi:hypothetical protein